MTHVFLVGVGGGLGSILRFLLGGVLARINVSAFFPWGTFTVNVLGCFMIGFLAGWGANRQFLTAEMRLFLFTGVLGGFTTFSAFSLETFTLLKSPQWLLGVLNILGQVVLGVVMVGLGNRIGFLF